MFPLIMASLKNHRHFQASIKLVLNIKIYMMS